MSDTLTTPDLKFFPAHAQLMAAKLLSEERWGEAFATAPSDIVVSTVIFNGDLMPKMEFARQLQLAMMRGRGYAAPASHVRLHLEGVQDELQSLSQQVPYGEAPWTVYRGICTHDVELDENPRHGFWTFDKDVANYYACRLNWSNGGQHLYKTEVSEEHFLFYDNTSEEDSVALLLEDDHPIEKIETFESDYVPLRYSDYSDSQYS